MFSEPALPSSRAHSSIVRLDSPAAGHDVRFENEAALLNPHFFANVKGSASVTRVSRTSPPLPMITTPIAIAIPTDHRFKRITDRLDDMKRIYLEGMPVIEPPPRGLNRWVLRSRREVMYATGEGFFQEDEKGLFRLSPKDQPARGVTVLGKTARADASGWESGEQTWRLPRDHVRLIFDTHVYAPRAQGPVRLAVRVCNEEPVDTYLEVDDGVTQATLDEDARTLLSGLKSCPRYTACLPQHLALS